MWFETAFELFGYPVSFLELISVSTGILAVYLAAKEHIWTWPVGLINICTAFFIYFHVHLYSDMFLQVYFLCISVYGWWFWTQEKRTNIPLKWLTRPQILVCTAWMILGTLIFGWFISNIHTFLPDFFKSPAAFPYADSWVAVSSILANTLMAKRYIENWIMWILIDVLCVYLYVQKDILFIAFEFLIFLGMAVFGLRNWIRYFKIQMRLS